MRSTYFERPDESFPTISSSSKRYIIRTHRTKSLVLSASVSIRMIAMLSIILWMHMLLSSPDLLPNKYYTIPTHPFPSISFVVVVFASTTTTMSAFVHPQRKRMQQLDGMAIRKFTIPSLSRRSNISYNSSNNNNNDVGGYDPSEGITVSERMKEKSNVGNPQQVQTIEKEFSVTSILKELAAIQQQGPQKYCILGTRHCSYLHQQIIELL